MEPMDISTLFGNALDNAIESVRKLPQEEKRLIHVAVARQKDFLRIRVENYYEGNLVFENGLPATTKEDKEYHGYGLKSIRSTVKKYGGSITIDTNENWFELRILIPLPI
jgi:sensor histidine kinase regulating citrate/malate metabolism